MHDERVVDEQIAGFESALDGVAPILEHRLGHVAVDKPRIKNPLVAQGHSVDGVADDECTPQQEKRSRPVRLRPITPGRQGRQRRCGCLSGKLRTRGLWNRHCPGLARRWSVGRGVGCRRRRAIKRDELCHGGVGYQQPHGASTRRRVLCRAAGTSDASLLKSERAGP